MLKKNVVASGLSDFKETSLSRFPFTVYCEFQALCVGCLIYFHHANLSGWLFVCMTLLSPEM